MQETEVPLVFGLSESTNRNLLVSFIDASDSRRRYSGLSITTTPDPLSGFVTTTSSRFFRSSIACKRALGGFGLLLLIYSSATHRKVAAASFRKFSFGRCRSRFQYAFSKLALISTGDTLCEIANFRPRKRTNFWKNDSS